MRTLTQNFIRMIDHLPGALLLAAVFLSPAATAWAQYVTNDTNAAWNPVLLRDSRLGAQNTVTLDSSEAFWYPRVTKLRDTSIPCGWSYVEAFITDCRNATLPNHPPSDALFAEGNHHKLTEATVYILSQWPNATDNPVQEPGQPTVTNFGTLAARVDAEADIARTAQLAHASRHPESSGYMHVRQSNFDAVPWENRYGCGDDYCMGYLMDMAAAHFIYSGGTNNKMLNISRDAALHCYNWFVVPSRPGTGVDGNIERGLLETYRCTGDSRIRDTANYFISQRGHNANGDPAPTLRLYFQDDVPIEQQQAINGHAGRAAGFYAGVANAVLLGRTDWYNAMFRVWRSDIKRKVYVSGGIGSWDSPNNGEAFSQNDYDLVNEYTGGRLGRVLRIVLGLRSCPRWLGVWRGSKGTVRVSTKWSGAFTMRWPMPIRWTARIPTIRIRSKTATTRATTPGCAAHRTSIARWPESAATFTGEKTTTCGSICSLRAIPRFS